MPLRMSRASGYYLSTLLAVLLVIGVQSWRLREAARQTPFEPAVRRFLHTPPSSVTCAECHQTTCEHFATAPHGKTLNSADEPWVRERFAGKSLSLAKDGPLVTFQERNQQLWMECDSAPEAIRVDWVFGSGRHALTPVSLLENPDGATELVEASVSWYPPGELGLTPGAQGSKASGMGYLGAHQDHRTTQECFGCHVTHLPMDGGRIETDVMIRGVSCDRCHPGSDEHARAMQQGRPDSLLRWSELSPLESVNRRGECHRRADQLTDAELTPERTVLVRFASVGLAMSPCFIHQDETPLEGRLRRLDCLTCHDPHRPAETSAEFYTTKCMTCHGSGSPESPGCSSDNTGTDCLSCHMPKVSVAEKLVLTDHWIRIRRSTDPPPTATRGK